MILSKFPAGGGGDKKVANGSGSGLVPQGVYANTYTIAVSGLDFSPSAVYVRWKCSSSSTVNESEIIDFNGTQKTVHETNNGIFTLTEDGFQEELTGGIRSGYTVAYSWLAMN